MLKEFFSMLHLVPESNCMRIGSFELLLLETLEVSCLDLRQSL